MDARAVKVAVVGAGVVGLAAAHALGRRGCSVTTFDPEPPGSGQSFGRVRAFRIAHPSVYGVGLAVQSRALWREWEDQWSEPLIRCDGLLISDPDREVWAAAMAEVGQPSRFPSREQVGTLCPLVDASLLDLDSLVFDPQAGAIDARATIDWLLAINGDHDWTLIPEHVIRVIGDTDGPAVVVTAGAERSFDAVVVAAGAGTEALAAGLGLHLDTVPQQRTWATMRPRTALPASAMWMSMLSGHRYGWAQLGPDGVVALSGDWSSNDPTDTSAGSLSAAVDYAESLMPVLDPATAKPQEMLVAPVTVPDGKPFAISTVGPVTLVEGNQLFKFAPLLGRMLADAVEGLPLSEVQTFESVGAA